MCKPNWIIDSDNIAKCEFYGKTCHEFCHEKGIRNFNQIKQDYKSAFRKSMFKLSNNTAPSWRVKTQ